MYTNTHRRDFIVRKTQRLWIFFDHSPLLCTIHVVHTCSYLGTSVDGMCSVSVWDANEIPCPQLQQQQSERHSVSMNHEHESTSTSMYRQRGLTTRPTTVQYRPLTDHRLTRPDMPEAYTERWKEGNYSRRQMTGSSRERLRRRCDPPGVFRM